MSPPELATIEMDQQCLSCNNVPEQVVKLFKLACLNYNQSKEIDFNGSKQSRASLINMKDSLITSIKTSFREGDSGGIFSELERFYKDQALSLYETDAHRKHIERNKGISISQSRLD